jgi:hypothetical protein
MTKLLFLFIFNILLSFHSLSQTIVRESIGAVGSSFSSDQFDLQSCLGQPYNTSATEAIDLRQGFIQPENSTSKGNKLVAIKLYPNPVSSRLNFSFENELQNVHLLIYDLMGNIVSNQHFNSLFTGFTNCSLWTAGMYFIQVQKEGQILGVEKFIKTNNN